MGNEDADDGYTAESRDASEDGYEGDDASDFSGASDGDAGAGDATGDSGVPASGAQGDAGGAQPMGLLKHWQAYCTSGHGWLAEWRFEWAMAVADSSEHWLANPQCKTEVREHGSW